MLVERKDESMGIFEKLSGLNRLAVHFASMAEPANAVLVKQTVKFGDVRYRRCVTVSIEPRGLFLWVRPPLARHIKLLIPWDHIKKTRASRLYGLPAVLMSIGDPGQGTITVYQDLFERIQANLT